MSTDSDRAWFLNVGQGHATLATSADEALLIDCPGGMHDVVRSCLMDEASRLVHVFITHRDLDHCGGVPAILDTVGAEHIHLNFGWALPPESDAKVRVKAVLSRIFSIAERDNLVLTNEYSGACGTMGTVSWELLAPTAVVVGVAALNDSVNTSSMVIRLTSNECRVLITGDADDATLKRLFDGDIDLAADVLLVPHHGARLAKMAEFLSRVEPRVVVVSAGRVNAFGHPRLETLLEVANRQNVYLACTQVSKTCHSGKLSGAECAGSVCIELAQPPVAQTVPVGHADRVALLEWPICLKKVAKA